MQLPAQVLEQIISKPRLDSYRGYWKVNADAAVGLYMWNGEVCTALSQTLSYFEIVLRNNIHRAMSESVSGGSSSSVHWWDSVWGQLSQSAQAKINEIRQVPPTQQPGPDEIVSRLTFGFWPNMLTWMGKNRRQLLSKVFPGHSLSQAGAAVTWMNPAARRGALREIFELKDIRNRIAHHEPLWKFAAIYDTSVTPALLIAPASTSEAGTVGRFARLLGLLDNAIMALSPVLAPHLRTASWRQDLDFLLSERGRDRYKQGLHVPMNVEFSPHALHQQFAWVVRENRPVKLRDSGGEGIFLPA